MKVQLIEYTGKGSRDPSLAAANLLIFTKNTRLEMDADAFGKVEAMSWDERLKELDYMAKTIPSSWEFVDYIFLITGVTRAFTHQFVRTRQGSYAQQTMRILNVSGFKYETGPTIKGSPYLTGLYDDQMAEIGKTYQEMIASGAKIEDARGILPTNIHTNIVAKFNMRTLCEMAAKRSSSRTQGEYRDVLEAMLAEVRRVHHWSHMFIDRNRKTAADELEAAISAQGDVFPAEERTRLIKLIDELRKD